YGSLTSYWRVGATTSWLAVSAGFTGAKAVEIFFFQAEDGIRDGHVTGVQTCALPIFRLTLSARGQRQPNHVPVDHGILRLRGAEIGRASCRERVWSGGAAGACHEEMDGFASRDPALGRPLSWDRS